MHQKYKWIMAFLFKLSEKDAAAKQAKRDALIAGLQEQVNERQAKKDKAEWERKQREDSELRKLEAQGLDMWGRPLKGIDVNRSQMSARSQAKGSPSRAPRNAAVHSRADARRGNGGAEQQENMGSPIKSSRQFMGALSEMYGPSEKERSAKELARLKLQADLAEQVRAKQAIKDAEKARLLKQEADEIQEMAAKGLDIWGRPLPPGKKPFVPKQRSSHIENHSNKQQSSRYKSPRVTPRHMPQNEPPHVVVTAPHIPKIDLSRRTVRPESDRADSFAALGPMGESHENYRDEDLEREIDEEERILSERLPSSLDELTNLCQKLLKEQVQLRKMVEKREDILERKSPLRKPRLAGSPGMQMHNKQKRRKPRTPTGARKPTRSRRPTGQAPADLPFGRRLANRIRGRTKVDDYGDYRRSKEEIVDAKKRRAAVRAEYANKSRLRNNRQAPQNQNILPSVIGREKTNALSSSSKFVYDSKNVVFSDVVDKRHPDALSAGVGKKPRKRARKPRRRRPSEPAAPAPQQKNLKPPIPRQPRRKPRKRMKELPKFVFDPSQVKI